MYRATQSYRKKKPQGQGVATLQSLPNLENYLYNSLDLSVSESSNYDKTISSKLGEFRSESI